MLENKLHLEGTSFSCLIYDLPESSLNLSDVFEFIGIYTFNPELVCKDGTDDVTFDLMEDVSDSLHPTKVPRLHCLISRKLAVEDFISVSRALQPLPNAIREIRRSLLGHLSTLLGNDTVAAQCLLLHLLSRVRGNMVVVGQLTLNLTGFTRESASLFGSLLHDSIMDILPFSIVIPISVEYLNNAALQPKKNNQTGRLVMAVLQLAQGTHLTIDETVLQAGVLNSTGVENARLLKHLMEWQSMLQDEIVIAMREDRSLNCSDLTRLLTMAQLLWGSFCETNLSLEHWQMVKELERLRKERLSFLCCRMASVFQLWPSHRVN